MRIPTTVSNSVNTVGLAFLACAFVLNYMRVTGLLEWVFQLIAMALIYFVCPALQMDDGIDPSRLDYLKSEKTRRVLWLATSKFGMVLFFAGVALWGFWPVHGGGNIVTPMRWAVIGPACLSGLLLDTMSCRALVALARTASRRKALNA